MEIMLVRLQLDFLGSLPTVPGPARKTEFLDFYKVDFPTTHLIMAG